MESGLPLFRTAQGGTGLTWLSGVGEQLLKLVGVHPKPSPVNREPDGDDGREHPPEKLYEEIIRLLYLCRYFTSATSTDVSLFLGGRIHEALQYVSIVGAPMEPSGGGADGVVEHPS